MQDALYKLPQQCDFSSVGNNSSNPNACSPILSDPLFSEFEGILINLPESVRWAKEDTESEIDVGPFGVAEGPIKLMVAGLARLPSKVLPSGFAHDVILVAVDQEAGRAYSGKMSKLGFSSRPLNVEPSPSSTEHAYFNIDLVQNLNLPVKQAVYTVYATVGDYTSNVRTVNVRIE